MIFQFSKKKYDDIFFSKEYHVSWLLKSSCFELSGKKKYGLLGAKKLVETLYLLITDKFWFWTFWVGKYRHFWVKKLMTERWYLLIIENFLFWTFRGWEIRSFFWNEKLMERLYLLGIFGLSCSVNSLSTSASLIFSMRDKYSLVFEVLL